MNKIEELKAKAAKAKQELVDAERIARKELQKAEQLEAVKKRQLEYDKDYKEKEVHAQKIVDELKKVGFKNACYVREQNRPRIRVAQSNPWYLSITWQTTNSHSYHRTGKPYLRIGSYDGKRFPLKKDGTYSYEKIAAEVLSLHDLYVLKEKSKKKNLQIKEVNTIIVDKINKEFGLSKWSGIVSSKSNEAGMVRIKLPTIYATEEEAVVILQAAKGLTIIK